MDVNRCAEGDRVVCASGKPHECDHQTPLTPTRAAKISVCMWETNACPRAAKAFPYLERQFNYGQMHTHVTNTPLMYTLISESVASLIKVLH